MKESEFVIAINPDENSPIKDECDIFIKGRMEDVIPMLIEELRKQKTSHGGQKVKMEHFDVAIIGGGSAGLAAFKQLSNLEKQAVLIEAGKTVGSKNVSGGILYSKKPKNGKVYNVEDVYGQEFRD